MANFVGLRLMKAGGEHRLIAFLGEGVVELDPTEADLAHEAGYYTMGWEPVDPLAKADSLVPEHVLKEPKEGGVMMDKATLDRIIRELKLWKAEHLARVRADDFRRLPQKRPGSAKHR